MESQLRDIKLEHRETVAKLAQIEDQTNLYAEIYKLVQGGQDRPKLL